MASNGGTLHGVPQPPHHLQPSPGGFTCHQCGLIFDSGTSLQVHMHYQHESQQSRWPPTSSQQSNNTPSTNIANRSPPVANISESNVTEISSATSRHMKRSGESVSPPSMSAPSVTTNTIAAADSSDSQSVPNYYQNQHQHQGYEQHHHYPGSDYPANGNLMMQPPHEYKSAVPPSRYHPYSSPQSHSANSSQQTMASPTTTTSNNVSPRIVSSTSPHHHLGQPTPSPSPKQCDKCGHVCATVNELNDHYLTIHSGSGSDMQQNNRPHSESVNNNEFANSAPSYDSPYGNSVASVKEEPACDILDLDSQKMVYPPHQNNNDPSLNNNNNSHDGPLPSMQSLHTMQRMHPVVMWHPASGRHDPYMQQPQHQHQREYEMMTPVIKSEYNSSVGPPPTSSQSHHSSSPSSGGVPSMKSSEYLGMSGDMKGFDQNSIPTSPSDFPTTTTPQDSNNNSSSQFRNFERPTSSLPTGIAATKSAAWKSNEARRPKTYNCTACNKWFTSSGHLKRHYNTTLHKNAVKASNQPDPATMPISVHHHPSRDPNSKHHRNNAQANNNHPPPQPQPPPPTDPQRSPDYAPQFAPAGAYSSSGAGGHHGAPTSTINQGFQQYSSLHSTAAIPPNGQAGPSVHASLPRGLLTYSTNNLMEVQPPVVLRHHIINSEITTTIPEEREQERPLPPIITHSLLNTTTPISTSTDRPEYISSRLDTITTTSRLSRPEVIQPPPNYLTTIGNDTEPDTDTIICLPEKVPYDDYTVVSSGAETYTIRLLNNATSTDIADTAPYSPSMPSDHHFKEERYSGLHALAPVHFERPQMTYSQRNHQDNMTNVPKLAETAPQLSPAPSSPSVTSSDMATIEQQQDAAKKYRCEQCDKTFNKSCYLTQHNKTFHSGEKPFKCHRCGKRFSCGQSHEEHVAKHGGDKPFKCELCPKAFNHKTDLRRHMCLHSGSKPFNCEECGKGFIRKDHLVKHMDVHKRKAEQMKRKADKPEGKGAYKKIKLEPVDEFEDSRSLLV